MQVSALAREAKELQGKTSQKKEDVKEEKKTSVSEGEIFKTSVSSVLKHQSQKVKHLKHQSKKVNRSGVENIRNIPFKIELSCILENKFCPVELSKTSIRKSNKGTR